MSLKPESTGSLSSKWTSDEPWSEVKHHTPGAYPPSPNPQVEHDMLEQSSIAAAVKARRHEYIRKKTVKIKVGTWNVAAMSGTSKDLPGWFVNGFGVKGLSNSLADLNVEDYSSSDDNIESVEDQESRVKKRHSTLPKHDVAALASDDDVGIYALGLQEVIDVTSATEALRPFYDPNAAKKWKHALKKSLPAGYKKVAEMQLLGLLILIYAEPSIAAEITSVDTQAVGTGLLGYVGNKGAVSVRIVLGGTTRIVFVNSHLAAGADSAALTRRIWDTNQILSRTKFLPANYDGDVIDGLHEQIGDEDFAFWFGDLNYRLDDIPGEDVRRLLLLHTRNEYDVLNKSKRRIDGELGYRDSLSTDDLPASSQHYEVADMEQPATHSSIEPDLDPRNDPASLLTTLSSLLSHDQLRAQQRLGKAFHEGWREGEINFLPTYKYDVGSVGMFDSGEKKRSPSWCDRILFRTRKDKEAFDARIRRETGARKRDEEMRARGLEQDVADQEVLFDYNPDTDGAGTGDYDEYDEAGDDVNDAQSVQTVEGAEDAIKLEDYLSHQRVLSSDHKPLSAVFSLTYDAVIPELKNRVHQEVTRNFDKNENETRPSLTVVVENTSHGGANADKPTGASELNAVQFDPVRFRVPQRRTVTIANTSPISVTFAFIDRPVEQGQQGDLAPSWLTIHVNSEPEPNPLNEKDLGSSTRFKLEPGDVTTVDLTVSVHDFALTHQLNIGAKELDEILVLRVLNGRDHFLRVKGLWLATCFSCTLGELVRVPSGVRHQKSKIESNTVETLKRSSSLYHSAPKELFALTEMLPSALERAVADWEMLREGEEPPWKLEAAWPFLEHVSDNADRGIVNERLAAIREALDTSTPIDDHLDSTVTPLERVELVAETLFTLLQSLRDGVIPPPIWSTIEEKLVEFDRSKPPVEDVDIQEMVVDVLSTLPVLNVSFTFVTFMLTRIITELTADASGVVTTPQSPQSLSSGRPSTSSVAPASESASVSSLDSAADLIKSPRSKFAFLTSIPGRGTGLLSAATTPTTPTTPVDLKKTRISTYVEKFAPVVIRSEHDSTARGKEKRTLELRKKKVLQIFLEVGMP